MDFKDRPEALVLYLVDAKDFVFVSKILAHPHIMPSYTMCIYPLYF